LTDKCLPFANKTARFFLYEKIEDTKRVIRRRKSKQDRQYNDQKKKKDEQWSTKYCTEKHKIENTNPHQKSGRIQELRNGK
jgi:hypothetical protein